MNTTEQLSIILGKRNS